MLNGSAKQTIAGNGNGQFGSITLANPAGISLLANATVLGSLDFATNLPGQVAFTSPIMPGARARCYRYGYSFGNLFAATVRVAQRRIERRRRNEIVWSRGLVVYIPDWPERQLHARPLCAYQQCRGGQPDGKTHRWEAPLHHQPSQPELTQYWNVKSTGFAGVSVTQIYTYSASDVSATANEATFVIGRLYTEHGRPLVAMPLVDPTANH